MSSKMRLSGLISGMDTDSIISQLVSVKRTKVTTLTNQQTKLSWKQDILKDLNKDLKSLQSSVSNMRLSSDFSKKATTVSDTSKASVICGKNAVDSVQTMTIDKLAKTAYLTGGTVAKTDGTKANALTKMSELGFSGSGSLELNMNGKTTSINITADTSINDVLSKLQDSGLNASFDTSTQRLFVSAKNSGDANNFTLTASGDGADALAKLGLQSKSYYEGLTSYTQADLDNSVAARMDTLLKNYGSQKTQESDYQTQITDLQTEIAALTGKADDDSKKALEEKTASLTELQTKLTDLQTKIAATETNFESGSISSSVNAEGKTVYTATASTALKDAVKADYDSRITEASNLVANSKTTQFATMVKGTDAEITLNGAKFTSSSNVFEINGLTITANATTKSDEPITLTTKADTSGIYDMVKNFLTSYNTVINKLSKLYSADSAKGYEPLSDEEKEAMSESEAEKYEQKIKDALLKGDSTINSISNALSGIMSDGVEINGKRVYLSDFGINTLSYFTAEENERNAYHIDGDSKDENTADNTDKLAAMITKDPDMVTSFFSKLSQSLYKKLSDLSSSVSGYRSYGSFYNDKKMTEEYSEYKTKISDMEDKVNDYEDKLYKQYSAMETAMAKLQSKTSAISALTGGS